MLFLIFAAVLLNLGQAEKCFRPEKDLLKINNFICNQKQASLWLAEKKDLQTENVCQVIKEIVDECSRIVSPCFDDKEMRLFQDHQMVKVGGILAKEHNLSTDGCNLKIKDSEEPEQPLSTDLCNVDKMLRVLINYQACVIEANDQTMNAFSAHMSFGGIGNTLCQGMNKIVHVCSRILETCYSANDIMETKKAMIELTAMLFKKLKPSTHPRGLVNAVKSCQAFDSFNSSVGTMAKWQTFLSIVMLGFIIMRH